MNGWTILVIVMWATTWIGAAICVVLSHRMKGVRSALVKAVDIINDQSEIIECLATRGVITCDSCGKPIAPHTPTAIDQYEPHRWRIEHRACAIASDVP